MQKYSLIELPTHKGKGIYTLHINGHICTCPFRGIHKTPFENSLSQQRGIVVQSFNCDSQCALFNMVSVDKVELYCGNMRTIDIEEQIS